MSERGAIRVHCVWKSVWYIYPNRCGCYSYLIGSPDFSFTKTIRVCRSRRKRGRLRLMLAEGGREGRERERERKREKERERERELRFYLRYRTSTLYMQLILRIYLLFLWWSRGVATLFVFSLSRGPRALSLSFRLRGWRLYTVYMYMENIIMIIRITGGTQWYKNLILPNDGVSFLTSSCVLTSFYSRVQSLKIARLTETSSDASGCACGTYPSRGSPPRHRTLTRWTSTSIACACGSSCASACACVCDHLFLFSQLIFLLSPIFVFSLPSLFLSPLPSVHPRKAVVM